MSLTLPPAKNYQSQLIAVPSRLLTAPPDGPRSVAMEFDWTTMGTTTVGTNGAATQTAIYVNMGMNANLPFSQLVSLKVDNSLCGCDVEFVFTDTGETVVVPAFTPNAIFPVFTDQKQFYAIALGTPLANDVTRVQALNFVPPPVTLEPSQEQNFALTAGMAIGNATTNLALVPAGVNGTLKILQLNYTSSGPPAAPSQGAIQVRDGAGNYLVNSLNVIGGQATPGQVILDLENANWRFSNGITMFWTVPSGGWSVGAIINATTAYRVP